MTGMVIALLAMIATGACSYEDPDIAFKGNIDNNFLRSLARGESSITLTKTGAKNYVMDYKKYLNGSGKWDEEKGDILGGGSAGIDQLIIINGRTWSPIYLFDRSTLAPSLILGPWNVYRKRTGFDKEVYIACPIEYDEEAKTLKIKDHTYSIEKAENKNLTLSIISEIYQLTDNYQWTITQASKSIVFYKKSAMETPDMDKVLYFDSEKEAKLAMVKILREYFGDVINLNSFGNAFTLPILNLAQLEENLRNGDDELMNGTLSEDPNSIL